MQIIDATWHEEEDKITVDWSDWTKCERENIQRRMEGLK